MSSAPATALESLTDTQREIVCLLRTHRRRWTPYEIARKLERRLLAGNAGAAAKTLRTLVRLGLVDQQRMWIYRNRIPRYTYTAKGVL